MQSSWVKKPKARIKRKQGKSQGIARKRYWQRQEQNVEIAKVKVASPASLRFGSFHLCCGHDPCEFNLLNTRDFCLFLDTQVTYLWEVIVVSPALFPEQEQVTKW